jgi:hypothetical protein
MSEFRQATEHVEALKARLAQLQRSVAESNDIASLQDTFSYLLVRLRALTVQYSLQKLRRKIVDPLVFPSDCSLTLHLQDAVSGDVDVMMEKFQARCAMVDPVTNQPRFGPKMLAKVQHVLRRYDAVKLAVDEDASLRLQVEAKIIELSEEETVRRQQEAARERQELEAQRAAELARQQEQERLQQAARAREAERLREEQRRMEALAAAAQKKRELREKEREEEERQRQLEEQERERLNASIPHGKEGLEMAIGMLKESTGSEVWIGGGRRAVSERSVDCCIVCRRCSASHCRSSWLWCAQSARPHRTPRSVTSPRTTLTSTPTWGNMPAATSLCSRWGSKSSSKETKTSLELSSCSRWADVELMGSFSAD